jgi:hypothetical protein
VWDSSYYEGSHKVLRALANGWQISPIITLHSGLPFTITTGSSNNGYNSSSNNRPDFVPGVPTTEKALDVTLEEKEFFNTGAFCFNNGETGTYACPSGVVGVGPNGQDGNVPRNALSGPSFFQVDMAIMRNFTLHENWVLQARFEAQNVFNLLNLDNPVTAMSSATYGQITGADDGSLGPTDTNREIQLGLRLTF